MSRIKIIIYIILLTAVVFLTVIYFKFPYLLNGTLFKNTAKTSPQSNLDENVVKPPTESKGVISNLKDGLVKGAKDSFQGMDNALEKQKQKILDKLTPDTPQPPVISETVLSQDNINSQNSMIITLDLSKTGLPQTELKKETDYILTFKNVPPDTCMYLAETKYPIGNNLALKIQFQKAGNYTLRTNSCDLNYKDYGVLTIK